MTTWPASLPQYLDVRGASLGLPENRLRSDVDIGPAKLRPIVSLNVRPLAGHHAHVISAMEEPRPPSCAPRSRAARCPSTSPTRSAPNPRPGDAP